MEFPKGFENQEQWVPVTPVKPIPPKKLPPISNPNWVESGGFGGSLPNPVQIGGGFREELRRLVLRSEGLAQMPYRRLLAIKDPAIASMMNIPPLLVARIGGGSSGGSEGRNSESVDRNQILMNGRIVFPLNRENGSSQSVPPLAPKPQCESSSNRLLYCSSGGSGAETNSESLDQNQIKLNGGIVFPSSRENGSSQSVPPLAPKPQCESSSSRVLYCSSFGSGAETNSESLDQNQILLNRGIVFPSSRENGSSQSIPPLAPKPQCESSSSGVLYCGSGGSGTEMISESLDQNQILLNRGIVFPSCRENGSSQSVPPLAPKPQCESSSDCLLDCGIGDTGAETNSESLDQNQITLNGGMVFPSSRENGSSQSVPPLAPKPQCESSSSRVLYYSSGGSGAETNSESLDKNQILLNWGIVFPLSRENGSNQSLPALAPKPQYKLPENSRVGRVLSEAMASPATPATMEKNWREIIDCLPRETIDLVGETTNESIPPCVSNQLESSQILHFQQQEGEMNVAVNSLEELHVHQVEGENQGIDLNKTPQQKPKRKKHRPKVIKEGTSAKKPQEVTPETTKTTENPSVKRKYVRKKKDLTPVENPSSTVQVVDQEGRSRTKSVKRSLISELEEAQEIDQSQGSSSTILRHNSVETQGREKRSSQRQGAVELKNSGFGFDGNQFVNENVRVPPTPSQPPQPSRLETMKTKYMDEFKRMVSKMSPSPELETREGENLKTLARKNSCRDIADNHERNLVDGESQAHTSGTDLCSGEIQKKRRTEDGPKDVSSGSSLSTSNPSSGWKNIASRMNSTEDFTLADAQRLMAEKRHVWEHMLMLNQAKRESNIRLQGHSSTSLCTPSTSSPSSDCKTDVNQPSTPDKPPGHRISEDIEIHGPQARIEVLISNQKKSKTRMRKKKDPVDDVIQKLRHLNINGGYQAENAMIPYAVEGGMMMVSFQGSFDIIKKKKPRAKVDLDAESNRVWKLLMGKESSEGVGETEADKEKWWEEERRVFRGRVDSFIARMHLIQGDRRFSRWKGSVVDSVIGVFLTQNVSDHLSSSAFMCLAAKFPSRSNCEHENAYVEAISRSVAQNYCEESSLGVNGTVKNCTNEMTNSNEPLESNDSVSISNVEEIVDLSKDSNLDFCGRELGMGNESPESASGTAVTVTSCTSEIEGEERRLLEDVISSQNSVASSQNSSEFAGQTTYKNSLSEPNFEANGSRSSFMELLEMVGNERISRASFASNYHKNLSNSGFKGLNNSDNISENYRSHLPLPLSSLEKNKDTSISDVIGRKYLSSVGNSTNVISNRVLSNSCLHQQDENLVMFQRRKREELQVEKTPDENKTQVQSQNICPQTCSKLCNDHQKVSTESLKNEPNSKKVKSEAEKKKSYDWDSLRKQACQNGDKKERSQETMDSLDYGALRRAHVSEISQAIRDRGMNNILAERIKDFLDRLVSDHGSVDLEWLRDVPPDKAKDYLLSIRGLGLKSVECVRLLTLHHLAFPVDTNVGRICVRLGWVPLQPLPESLQLHLLEMYPVLETIQRYLWPRLCMLDQRTLYELHYQLITFGKVFCTKSKPNCNACPMRGECKHFASAFASARLALPGPEDKSLVRSEFPISSDNGNNLSHNPIPLPQLVGTRLSHEQTNPKSYEPIIEEPTTPEPEPECIEPSEIDIEDAFYNDPDEIPTIKLNFEEFTQNLQTYIQEHNMELQNGDMSKALVAMNPKAASIPMPKLKNINRLRTEHLVYELPDSHPLLEGIDKREPDDPCPYLLAIWTPGETAQSIEPPQACCNSQDTGNLCDRSTCFSCNSIREAQAHTVRGTLLIPCRTANRGSFPLNGTYFQVNEVFADHSSSCDPIDVPRDWIWNLPRRTVYFGTSIPSIFKGLTTEGIQHCFWRGFVCVRGFDRITRAPKPLFARLHFPASKTNRSKRTEATPPKNEETAEKII